MKKSILLFYVISNVMMSMTNIATADDSISEKLSFSVMELKVKYYNAINLYDACSEFDKKYKKLNENSFKIWFNKNNPLFERVLSVFGTDKTGYFDNPDNHKKLLKKQFLEMSMNDKLKLCAGLKGEYESKAMNFEESHREVFLFIYATEKIKENKGEK